MDQKPIIPYSRLVGDDGAIDRAKQALSEFLAHIKKEAEQIKGILGNIDIKDTKGLTKIAKDVEGVKNAQIAYKKSLEEVIKVEKLEAETKKEGNKISADTATGIDKLNIELEQQRYALKALNQMEREGMISIEEATVGRARLKTMMSDLSKEIKNQTKLEQAKQVIENGSIDTLEQVRERMSALRLVVQNTSTTTEEGKQKIIDYNNEINDLTDKLSNNSDKFIQNKINVGNYTQSIKDALSETTLFGVNVGQVGQNLEKAKGFFSSIKTDVGAYFTKLKEAGSAQNGLTVAQRASAVSTTLLSGGLKVLRLALISTGIGAIIVLLGSLISYFSGTEDGANKLTMILEPLKAIFSALQGVLNNVGRVIVGVFENPKKAMKDLYEFVKNNLINRFTAFGVILDGIINLDFKKVTNGALQAVSGVENMTDKIAEGAKQTNKFLEDSIEKGKQIARLSIEIGQTQLKWRKANFDAENKIAELEFTADTKGKPLKERVKAINEILDITEKTSLIEQDIVKKKIQQFNLEMKNKGIANMTLEDKNRERDLIEELDDAEDRRQEKELQYKNVKQKLINETAELEKQKIKELQDLRIRNLQAELALFTAQQGYKIKSYEEQIAFEQQTKEKRLAILRAEYETGKILKKEYEAKKLEIQNEAGLKQAQLVEKIIQDNADLEAKNSKRLTGETKLVNEEILKLETERLAVIRDGRIRNAKFFQFLGVKTERETNALIEQANKEYTDSQLQAQADFNKNRIEQTKANTEAVRKINLDAINKQIDDLLAIDPTTQSEAQREKTLKSIEEFEKKKLKIESQYKEASNNNRIAEIDNELALVEAGSAKEIELNREKENLITENQKAKQQERLDLLAQSNKKQADLAKEFKDTITTVIAEVFKALDKVTNKQIENQQKLLETQKKAVDTQQRRAEEGLENTLAFEQEMQAKREAELIKAQKRQERLAKIKAIWTSYNNYSNDPNNKNGEALTKTLKDFAILEAITASFGDGGLVADKVPTDANGITRGRSHRGNGGGIPVMVERGEGFFSAREVDNLGVDNFRTFKNMLGKGKVSPNLFSKQRSDFMATMPVVVDNSNLERGLEGVRQEIKNKPYQQIDVEQLVSGFLAIKETTKTPTKTTKRTFIVKKDRF